MSKRPKIYDAIVVGAGLAGLSSAHELRDREVMVLEKGAGPGGRVLTKKRNGISYELGALFAYEPSQLPFEMEPSPLIREEGRVGASIDGRITLGDSVPGVIGEIAQRLEDDTIDQGSPGGNRAIENVIDAFFNVIHPGKRAEYLDTRKPDALVTWPSHHFAGGNSELIDTYMRRIGAEIEPGSNVRSVHDQGEQVMVTYICGNRELQAFSKIAVIATPAAAARTILKTAGKSSMVFLNAVRYGSGRVGVLCLRDGALLDFRYLVTPYQKMNAVLRSKSGKPGCSILTVYYLSHENDDILSIGQKDLFSLTLSELNKSGIGNLSESDVIFFDSQPWEHLGTIIDRAYSTWTHECARPTRRVFLAGDYPFWTEDRFPYGMTAAIRSGQETGKAAAAFLDEE